MKSIFSRIVDGEIPCHKIAENDKFLAFLDVFPLAKGHTLVIPKQQIDYIFDIDDDVLGEMMIFAKTIATALKQAVPCTRIGVAVIGLEVPHAHIHLVPINHIQDINFTNPKLTLPQEELANISAEIRAKF
ncbi:MAG: HIT family protein [Saprospiraceae bacterium]|nr:HIT family protein [Saprospiraceae bacterium]